MRYMRDSMCVPVEIEDDEENKLIRKDFKQNDLYDSDDIYQCDNRLFKKDDVIEFIQTLDKETLIEILARFSEDSIVSKADAEKFYDYELTSDI